MTTIQPGASRVAPTGDPLVVDHLSVRFGRRRPAVSDVSFRIEPGERVGLIGESGSGKTVTALAIMGLLPETAAVTGSIRLGERELLGLPDRSLAPLRGDRLSMVFQEPMTALDPTMTVGRQVAEVLRLHQGAPPGRARETVLRMLIDVGVGDAARVADSYPHQLSGGQRQRCVLAMALVNTPDLVLCDEPTTALDVTVQARVLQTLLAVLDERGSACLFISHDLAVVSQVCERVLVVREGRLVESGTRAEVFGRPRDAYTKALVATSRLDALPVGQRLPVLDDFLPVEGGGR